FLFAIAHSSDRCGILPAGRRRPGPSDADATITQRAPRRGRSLPARDLFVPSRRFLCYHRATATNLDTQVARLPRNEKPMIKVDTVTKVYKDSVVALSDVSIDIGKGEFAFVVGPSGSGKSTLIRLLLKEEDPTKGDIYIAGKHIAKLSAWKIPYLRRNIGTVFQDFKLLPDRTVAANVGFALEVIGKPRSMIRERVQEVCELVGLKDKLRNFPDELSGG